MSSLDFGLLTPYARDIDPGTEAGAKAYSRGSLAGSIEKKDRTKLTVQSAEKVRDQIRHVETTFSWNILTREVVHGANIVVVTDSDGDSTNTCVLDTADIVGDHILTLQDVQRQARWIWGSVDKLLSSTSTSAQIAAYQGDLPSKLQVHPLKDNTDDGERAKYFARVRSQMIADGLRNFFDDHTLALLDLRKDAFTWTDADGKSFEDGPTMLFVLFDMVAPSKRSRGQKHFGVVMSDGDTLYDILFGEPKCGEKIDARNRFQERV